MSDTTDTRLSLLERVAGQLWSAVCRLQVILDRKVLKPAQHRYTLPPVVIAADPTWGQTVRVGRTRTVTAPAVAVQVALATAGVPRTRTVTASDSAVSLPQALANVGRTRTVTAAGAAGLSLAQATAGVPRTRTVTALDSATTPPAGTLVGDYEYRFSGAAKIGWLKCDGSTFSSTTYPALAALLGDTFGIHAGTTYHLPNLIGTVPLMAGTAPSTTVYNLGDVGGQESVQLTSSQSALPAHHHGIDGGAANFITNTGGAGLSYAFGASTLGIIALTDDTTQAVAASAHENRQPYLVAGNWYIRALP